MTYIFNCTYGKVIVNVPGETRSKLSGRGGRQCGMEKRVRDTHARAVGGGFLARQSQRASSYSPFFEMVMSYTVEYNKCS